MCTSGINKTRSTELTTCTYFFEIIDHNCKSKTSQVSIYVWIYANRLKIVDCKVWRLETWLFKAEP